MTDIEQVAKELYGLAPAEFTAARDERAKQARSDGDQALATAIKALRRPSRSAWLANLLVRQEPAAIEELLQLGETMRTAQLNLDGDELRRLTGERRTMVNGLVNQARSLAGEPVSEPIARELEGIFGAAISSEEAAQELAAGCLSAAVAADGGAALSWTGGGAQVIPLRPRRPSATPTEKPRIRAVPTPRTDEGRVREAKRQADLELKAANEAFEAADTVAEQARRAADDAADARKEAGRRIAELAAELEKAQQDRTAADRDMRVAGRNRDNLQRQADRARRRLERAQARVEELGRGDSE